MGSISPIRSEMVTSGVASFSPYRRDRPIHSMGVSSPCSDTRSRARRLTGAKGELLISQPAITGRYSSSSEARARRIRVFACPRSPRRMKSCRDRDRVDQFGDDGLVVTDDAGEDLLAAGKLDHQVVPHLVLDGPLRISHAAQRTDGRGSGVVHVLPGVRKGMDSREGSVPWISLPTVDGFYPARPVLSTIFWLLPGAAAPPFPLTWAGHVGYVERS